MIVRQQFILPKGLSPQMHADMVEDAKCCSKDAEYQCYPILYGVQFLQSRWVIMDFTYN